MARKRLADLSPEAVSILEAIIVAHMDHIGWPPYHSREAVIKTMLRLVENDLVHITQHGEGRSATFRLRITDQGRKQLGALNIGA